MSPAASFFTTGGVGKLVDRKGLAIGLRLRSKGVGSCNVLGSSNVVGTKCELLRRSRN